MEALIFLILTTGHHSIIHIKAVPVVPLATQLATNLNWSSNAQTDHDFFLFEELVDYLLMEL